jgi:hypothetical protein
MKKNMLENVEKKGYTKNDGESGMAMLRYTFMNDILFKMLFTKHPELLKKLVAAMLDIFV